MGLFIPGTPYPYMAAREGSIAAMAASIDEEFGFLGSNPRAAMVFESIPRAARDLGSIPRAAIDLGSRLRADSMLGSSFLGSRPRACAICSCCNFAASALELFSLPLPEGLTAGLFFLGSSMPIACKVFESIPMDWRVFASNPIACRDFGSIPMA